MTIVQTRQPLVGNCSLCNSMVALQDFTGAKSLSLRIADHCPNLATPALRKRGEKAFRWREALALLEEAHAVRCLSACELNRATKFMGAS